MKCLKYTLLCDGSSDRALIPIINWLLKEHFEHIPVQAEWADLYRLPQRPASLAERIVKALDYYPCDILFIHRDAEADPRLQRANEIGQAVKSIESQLEHVLSRPANLQHHLHKSAKSADRNRNKPSPMPVQTIH